MNIPARQTAGGDNYEDKVNHLDFIGKP